ncbi:hypothetical protein K2X89_05380 [Myxococcota bacterium]|nr:hypothetical protein [Myxococcota bacterium]
MFVRVLCGLTFALVAASAVPCLAETDGAGGAGGAEGALPTVAAAGAQDWEFEVGPYLWLSMIDGEVDTARFGNRHFNADLRDVLKAFDAGVMGNASLRWKRFLFLTDLTWSRLSDRDDLADTQVRYELEQEIGWLQALAGYRVYQKGGGLFRSSAISEARSFDVDAFAGLTYTWIDNKLDLARDPGAVIPAQNRTIRERDDWTAPYLAMRLRNDFTDRVESELFVGVGGFGAGNAPDAAWQAYGLLAYAITDHLRLTAGYRGQGLEKGNLTLNLHGPVLGASVRY